MEVVHKVLENELLREKILGYVISCRDLKNSDVKSCRLVQKTWLHSTSRCFRVSRKPLFNLELNNWNFCGRQAAQGHSKNMLDKFLHIFTAPSRIEDIPAFRLTVDKSVLLSEKHCHRLWELLPLCATSLVELKLEVPQVGFKMSSELPNLIFPLLQKFNVIFCESHRPVSASVPKTNFGINGNTTQLIQLILNGCSELRSFSTSDSAVLNTIIPLGYDDLQLPSTITELEFMDELKGKNYKFLLESDLPKIGKLILKYSAGLGQSGVLHNILEKFSGTLETFCCRDPSDIFFKPALYERAYFKLPEMKKLNNLAISVPCLELEEGLNNLQEKLPALINLQLGSQTQSSFRKWTAGSQFKSLKKIDTCLQLVKLDPLLSSQTISVTFDMESIKLLHTAFPNLENLSLELSTTNISVLPFIFSNMTQLVVLNLSVNSETATNSEYWISLLLGIPETLAIDLRNNPSSMEQFQRKWSNSSYNSLHNLAELRRFNLYLDTCDDSTLENGFDEWICIDPVLEIALMKMPKLTKCVIDSSFSVSAEIIKKWRNAGRDLQNP